VGRAARGTVLFQGGRWKARIQFPDGGPRRTVLLPIGLTEEQAREHALELSQTARQTTAAVAAAEKGALETVEEYGDRYVTWKVAKGQTTALDTRGRLRKWVYPVIGRMPITQVRSADLEAVVRNLDAAVGTKRIEAKTAENAWGDVTGLFKQACMSKEPTLKVRTDNPSNGVLGPDGGEHKEKPILFPDEFMRLISCEAVPVSRRRMYVFAVYIGARANEVAALTAADFDVGRGLVTISKQRDRRTDADKKTKTKRTRVTSIEPELLPLVEAMAEARPRGRLFAGDDPLLPNDEARATQLREDLRAAGVLRRELHERNDPSRLPMWFHHLRDTGLTWMAIRGDDPLRIQWRGGHTDFRTTQRYIAQGRMLADGGAFKAHPPFPPLPRPIIPARIPARLASGDQDPEGRTEASPTGFEPVAANAMGPDLDGSRSVGSQDPGSSEAIGAHSVVPARRLEAGELHPRDAARIARDATVAIAVRRCQALALQQDERGTTQAIHEVAELLRGRS